MAVLNNSNAISPSGYNLTNSLRLRASASAYLTRTQGNGSATSFTASMWVKRGQLTTIQHLLNSGSVGTTEGYFRFNGSDALEFQDGTNLAPLTTTAVFRDPSAWYHIVLSVNTANATAADRVIVYVNGTRQTTTGTHNGSNLLSWNKTGEILAIGRFTRNTTNYFDGYITEAYWVDGQQLTPSSFGSTDTTTGQWLPKAYTSTYGTNGFYQKYSDIAQTVSSNVGLGKDFSGNTNYFVTNNISTTAGTTYDAMTDVPTLTSATVANYAVLNLLKQGSAVTVSNGNLRAVGTGAAWGTVLSSIGMTSGKWYCEITVTANSNSQMFGICQETATLTTYVGASAVGYGYYAGGDKYNNGVNALYGASYTANDVIGIAYDADIGSLTFYKNNSSQGVAYSGLSTTATWFFAVSAYNTTNTNDINFGQRPFSYTPPTGFVRLNAYNLPDSTIKKGNTVMDVALRTGTGTADGQSQVISSLAFTPDLVWNKARSNAFNHNLVDSVRGNDTILFSNLTNAETSVGTTGTQLQITTNGFTAIQRTSYQAVNQNGVTYADWCWQAGQGSTSSGTGTGGITSVTQSVNATAGFSIVTYTGSGANGTVTHGLGVAPKFYVVKNRSIVSTWRAWITGFAGTEQINLNETTAKETQATTWNSTVPTSTVISLGTSAATNGNGNTFVAYCWAEIAGFSKFGSYTGNGSTDGPFVYTGFRPKFIMIKRTNAVEDWMIWDTSRSPYNAGILRLYPNTSGAENNTDSFDILSNGFKCRDNDPVNNASGSTYIYAAFAENPFKNANAR